MNQTIIMESKDYKIIVPNCIIDFIRSYEKYPTNWFFSPNPIKEKNFTGPLYGINNDNSYIIMKIGEFSESNEETFRNYEKKWQSKGVLQVGNWWSFHNGSKLDEPERIILDELERIIEDDNKGSFIGLVGSSGRIDSFLYLNKKIITTKLRIMKTDDFNEKYKCRTELVGNY